MYFHIYSLCSAAMVFTYSRGTYSVPLQRQNAKNCGVVQILLVLTVYAGLHLPASVCLLIKATKNKLKEMKITCGFIIATNNIR